MSKPVYKVLDVREHHKIGKVQFVQSHLSNTYDVIVPQTLHDVVIAEDVDTHARTRFDFFPAYTVEIGGKTHYGGYCGDYSFLVSGDHFWVSDTSPKVVHFIDPNAAECS